MLADTAILAKTAVGRDAVAKRSHGLNPRQRAVLISINGELDIGALRRRLGMGQAGEPDATVELLLREGLVENVAPAAPAPAPSSAPSAVVASSDGPPAADAIPAAAPVPVPVPVPSQASVGVDGTIAFALSAGIDWRTLQSRAGVILHELMGPDADLLAMRIERARSEVEFIDHLERSFAVVESARGESAAVRYRLGVLAA
jgi:hypothetical protein